MVPGLSCEGYPDGFALGAVAWACDSMPGGVLRLHSTFRCSRRSREDRIQNILPAFGAAGVRRGIPRLTFGRPLLRLILNRDAAPVWIAEIRRHSDSKPRSLIPATHDVQLSGIFLPTRVDRSVFDF